MLAGAGAVASLQAASRARLSTVGVAMRAFMVTSSVCRPELAEIGSDAPS
jgi:hypothetical protein